jgi:hypothetical protein
VDPEEIPPVRREPGAPLTFAYTGSIYGLQGPGPLLDALEGLIAGGEIPAGGVRVRIAGADYAGIPAGRRIAVEVMGRLPHDRVGPILAGSDVLFLCLPRQLERQLPTKLYEYMASGRPILALAPPDSVAARRVRERGAGWVAAVEDPTGIAETLRSIYHAWKRDALPSCDGPASVVPYTRFRMAQTLASLLQELV